MATIDRKSSIRKAPAADVVEILTQQSANTSTAVTTPEPAEPVLNVATVPAGTGGGVRPGPGRPRSKRRMEPFSSKIEISLRDELDDYLAQHGMTVVDFLDQAIREHLKSNNTV